MAAGDPPTISFTGQLYSLDKSAVSSATQHPFLAQAGAGTLPTSTLCTWLVQDKYYQLAYLNFIGGLIAKVPLSSSAFTSPASDDQSNEENLPWTVLDVLISALTNIREEIDFYTKTVKKYKLPITDAPPDSTTKKYVGLFEAASAKDVPLIIGLVLLWATERCYLDAWTYALSQNKSVDNATTSEDDGGIAALREEFIPNWTCEPFRDFVKRLASVTDAWATTLDVAGMEACERIWLDVLELEAKFWPSV